MSGVVHNLICLKVLAEITSVTFRSNGCSYPVYYRTDKWTYRGYNFVFLTLHKRSRSHHCCSEWVMPFHLARDITHRISVDVCHVLMKQVDLWLSDTSGTQWRRVSWSIYLLLRNKELPMFIKWVQGLVFCSEVLLFAVCFYILEMQPRLLSYNFIIIAYCFI